jgi:hypothetical protein
MRQFSNSIRSKIGSTIFALIMGLAISLSVYFVFKYIGMPVSAKYWQYTFAALGLSCLRSAYQIWKQHTAEQGTAKTPNKS